MDFHIIDFFYIKEKKNLWVKPELWSTMNCYLLNRSIWGFYDKFLAFFIVPLIFDIEDKKLIYQIVIFFSPFWKKKINKWLKENARATIYL